MSGVMAGKPCLGKKVIVQTVFSLDHLSRGMDGTRGQVWNDAMPFAEILRLFELKRGMQLAPHQKA